jgi:hypothetical protein
VARRAAAAAAPALPAAAGGARFVQGSLFVAHIDNQ